MELGSQVWSSFIGDEAQSFQLDLDYAQILKMTIHARELIKWTRRINITTITDPQKIASHHFLDSLAPAPLIPPRAALLDIGSGGGFPGIPLKVALPGLSVTLIDASRKKVNFLKHIIRTLELDHIEAHHIRAEELAALPAYAGRFDVVISRALSSLETFVLLGLPLISDRGMIIAMKGPVNQTELDNLAVHRPGEDGESGCIGRQLDVTLKKYSLPSLSASRSIVVVNRSTHLAKDQGR